MHHPFHTIQFVQKNDGSEEEFPFSTIGVDRNTDLKFNSSPLKSYKPPLLRRLQSSNYPFSRGELFKLRESDVFK